MTARRTKRSAALGLLACAAYLAAAPGFATEPAPAAAVEALAGERAAEISARLGELLHNLDQDQSRRLSRAVQATTRYRRVTLGETADLLAHHPDQVLVLFAQRRRTGQTRLDLQGALLLPADGNPAPLTAKAQARDSYVLAGPLDASWNPLIARLAGAATGTPRAAGLDALAKSRVAAFVFLLKADAAGQRRAQQLILVPDTIRISIGAEGVAGPSSGDADAAALPAEEPYYDETEGLIPPDPGVTGPTEASPEQ